MSKLLRIYHTLKYLKWIQIKYLIKNRLWGFASYTQYLDKEFIGKGLEKSRLQLKPSLSTSPKWVKDSTFQFLNITHDFGEQIDWNYNVFGKLWTYNLNYFEFLHQYNISKEKGILLINDFNDCLFKAGIVDGMEPFPVSLRIINWIKFLIENDISVVRIDKSLFAQVHFLNNNLEHHLMGNHLLENAYALFFGGIYLNDKSIIENALSLLSEQLEEQILEDGAHFELSPMYHQLILFRLLDTINLIQSNNDQDQNQFSDFLDLLEVYAQKMLSWLNQISFSDGSSPMVNDSAPNICPSREELNSYASTLNLSSRNINLSDSGYRMIRKEHYECFVDVGNIGPDYIPGHAHSDTFNFLVHINAQPFIVDTGISTYEKNFMRQLERSTSSHNTVMINDKEQSDVWGGFRVGKRAKIISLTENEKQIIASHDGFAGISAIHQRTWNFERDSITIFDEIPNNKKGKAFLHFHPSVNLKVKGNNIFFSNCKISIEGAERILLLKYDWCTGFNAKQLAPKLVILFSGSLKSRLII